LEAFRNYFIFDVLIKLPFATIIDKKFSISNQMEKGLDSAIASSSTAITKKISAMKNSLKQMGGEKTSAAIAIPTSEIPYSQEQMRENMKALTFITLAATVPQKKLRFDPLNKTKMELFKFGS
jgi:uncharacterized protein with beta-barrel porin domain